VFILFGHGEIVDSLVHFLMHPHSPWKIQMQILMWKQWKKKLGVHTLSHSTSGVEGHVRALGWGLRRMTSESIIHMNLHRPNNKLVSAWLEEFWCTGKPHAYTNSQDSPRPKFGGSHHLPPYSILCAWPQGLHPNVILSQDSQVGNP
jgi:hypothetical protein